VFIYCALKVSDFLLLFNLEKESEVQRKEKKKKVGGGEEVSLKINKNNITKLIPTETRIKKGIQKGEY
jgi:hypothetical protein